MGQGEDRELGHRGEFQGTRVGRKEVDAVAMAVPGAFGEDHVGAAGFGHPLGEVPEFAEGGKGVFPIDVDPVDRGDDAPDEGFLPVLLLGDEGNRL